MKHLHSFGTRSLVAFGVQISIQVPYTRAVGAKAGHIEAEGGHHHTAVR